MDRHSKPNRQHWLKRWIPNPYISLRPLLFENRYRTDIDILLCSIDRPHHMALITLLLYKECISSVSQFLKPEITVAIRLCAKLLTALDIGQGYDRFSNALIILKIIYKTGDKYFRQTCIIDPWFYFRFRLQWLGLAWQSLNLWIGLLAKGKSTGGAGIHAPRLFPAIIQEVCAERALLSDIKRIIEVNDVLVRAGRNTHLVTATLEGVNDDCSIVPLVNSLIVTGRYTGGIVTVLTDTMLVSDLYFGNLSPHIIIDLIPELSGIRLRLRDK
jgi:hypothetical protein